LIVLFIMNAREDIFASAPGWLHRPDGHIAHPRRLNCSSDIAGQCRSSTGAVVLIFGALTSTLRDDTFIKMKPTIA